MKRMNHTVYPYYAAFNNNGHTIYESEDGYGMSAGSSKGGGNSFGGGLGFSIGSPDGDRLYAGQGGQSQHTTSGPRDRTSEGHGYSSGTADRSILDRFQEVPL